MRARIAFRVLCALTTALLALFLSGDASSRVDFAPAGQILLTLDDGSRGPLELVPNPSGASGQGAWTGTFRVTNVGAEPLTVSRVAVRGDEDDVRSPPRISARFVEGAATSAALAPGASREILVSWAPDRPPRMRQAFGHVVVTSTDEPSGEVAMGFRAQLPTGLGWVGEHALSLLVFWPLAVVLVAAAARLAGRADDRVVRRAAIAVSAVQLLLALWAYRRFAPEVGRADGNDGFQLVERLVWVRGLGAEWYLGVDGASVVLLLLAAAVGLVAVLIADEQRRSDAYYAGLAVLASGVAASFVALDLVVLAIARGLVVCAVVYLVGGWGGPRAQRAAARLGVMGAIGLLATALAFAALSGGSGRTFLVDGTSVPHTASIPELARVSFASKAHVAGLPFADATWVLLLVGVMAASPLVPMHGWLADALAEGSPGVALAVGGVAVALGPFLLLRVGLEAVPDGARWAGASVAALGGVTAVWGGLGAMAQRDLRRFAAYAVLANVGLTTFGIGALDEQGIAGGVAGLFAHGVGATLLLATITAIERRCRTSDAMRVQGLVGEAPGLALLFVAGLAMSLGAPGLAGSWALLLSLVGGFVRHPFVALLIAGSLVASAAAHFRVARILFFDKPDPAWRKSRRLEPFGGRLPDATSLELAALVPLAALALALGLWPAPMLAPLDHAAHDASAAFEAALPP